MAIITKRKKTKLEKKILIPVFICAVYLVVMSPIYFLIMAHKNFADPVVQTGCQTASLVRLQEEVDTQYASTENNKREMEHRIAPGYTNRWGIEFLSDEERLLLAQCIYSEGHNTGLEGCAKIAVVIFNRFYKGNWCGNQPNSISAVISAPDQFSVYPMCTGITPTEQEYKAIELVLTGKIGEEIYNGEWLSFNGDGYRNYFR